LRDGHALNAAGFIAISKQEVRRAVCGGSKTGHAYFRRQGISLDCSQILAFNDAVALNRIRICDQSRLWQRNYPAAPENSAAL
jgi:hypothetical protein